MPHEEINLNGLNFPLLFENTPFRESVGITNQGLATALANEASPPLSGIPASAVLHVYQNSFKIDNRIASWDALVADWRDLISPLSTETDPQIGPLFELFVENYREALNIGTTGMMGVDDPVDGDWSILAAKADVDADTIKQQFVNAFNHFLTTVSYDPKGEKHVFDPTNPGGDLLTQLEEFLGIIAVIEDGTAVPGTIPDIATYQQVYKAFFPDASDADFEDALVEFYNERLKENGNDHPLDGFFIPSMEFARWFEKVQSDFSIQLSGSPTIRRTSLASANFRKVSILLRIFVLLSEMVSVLQKVATAQASRLRFLTEWQRAYTKSLQQIHVFAVGSNDWLGATDGSKEIKEFRSTARGQLNTDVNASWQELMRGNRDVIKDDAKSLQSTVNQTNDAVNQQANMATSILQQFSTILSALFR